MTPLDVRQGDEPLVRMRFPRPVFVTLAGFRMVSFGAGIQDVPESLSREPYLIDSGATAL